MKRTELERNTPLRAKKPWRPARKALKQNSGLSRRSSGLRPRSPYTRAERGLDKLVVAVVKARDGGCVVCGAPDAECHHIFGKNEKFARFDPDFCIRLCRNCHQFGADSPHTLGRTWLESVLMPALLRAGREAQWAKIAAYGRYEGHEKVQIKATRAALKARLAELESTAWMDVRDREYGRAV